MNDRDRRWFALVVGVVLFAVGAVIAALRRRNVDLLPDFLMYIGGAVAIWMAAKLFWTDNVPEWFAFLVILGWMIIVVLIVRLIQGGVLL